MQSSNSEIITSLYNEWRRDTDIDSIFPGVKHNSQNTLIVLKNKIVLKTRVGGTGSGRRGCVRW